MHGLPEVVDVKFACKLWTFSYLAIVTPDRRNAFQILESWVYKNDIYVLQGPEHP